MDRACTSSGPRRPAALCTPLEPAAAAELAGDLRAQAGYAASAFGEGPRRPPLPFLRVPVDPGAVQSNLRTEAAWPTRGEPDVVLGTGPALLLTYWQALDLADLVAAAAGDLT